MSEQPTSSTLATTNDTPSSSRRSSVSRQAHRRGLSGITPRELKYIDDVIPLDRRQKWKKYSVQPIESSEQFESEFVRNIETSLGRSLFNCDTLAAYQATARSLRDTLIVRWNRTQQKQTLDDPKRVYYLSLEYLMGRALDNAALNLGLEKDLKQGLDDFGFKFEDVVEREPDAGLGNGGLGRLAACFVDSLCTLDYPAWAYGIRYKYGIFRQKIVDGAQVEFPDTWLDFGNPWEIPRPEVSFDVMFYGRVENKDGKKTWLGGDLVEAKAYDFLVPGFDTKNVNTLRLWQAEPSSQFDFARFNEGDYSDAVADQVDASTISAVLYPNDNFYEGKELRLKQQYFWVAASLADILRRFKKTRKPWKEFADSCAIQLNDTHPTLAIVELLRLLVDNEGLDWHEAWAITTSTFAYTNHTVMPEALEKWGVDILGNLLPRHLEIIYNVNYFFLKDVGAKFPGDEALLSRVSLIEESTPKQVRMAYLAVIASHKVNGVAELHSDLIKTTIFADFVKIFGEEHFTNITNGITPRRWLLEANPELAALIASKLGGYGYLKDLDQLEHVAKYAKDPEFRKQWVKVKQDNKVRLVELIKSQNPGIEIDPTSLFDIQVKRIHEYKRQQLNLFGIVYRYLYIKSLTPEQRSLLAPRVFIFGGKSAPGYYAAKLIIKLINSVGKTIAADPDVNKYLKIVYIEEYNVSKAQILVAASDISEHISTAGTEASGTSNMKFVLNGGLIIGTVDGANIEIGREIGEENIYYFGHLSESVDEVRNETKGRVQLSDKLAKVFETIDSGVFGEPSEFTSLLDSIRNHGDYYLVNADFDSYINTQSKIDEDFKDQEAWTTKSINSVSKMGFFSSDRAISQYADEIWDIQPNAVEGPDPLSPKVSHATLGPVSAAQGIVADKKAPKNKNKRKSVINPAAATGAGAPTGSGVDVATASAAALGAAGIGAAASTRDISPGLGDDTSSQYSNTDSTDPTTTTGAAPTTSGHQTYVVGGPKIVHGAAHNTAAGAAASAAFNKDSTAPRQETYNPLGGADEGQVAGSYGNYGASSNANATTSGVSSTEPASYGSAGSTSAHYGTASGSVPPPSHGTLDSTKPLSSQSQSGSNQSSTLGKSVDSTKLNRDAGFTSDPASSKTEGVSALKHGGTHDSKGVSSLPIHDTKLSSAGSSDPVSTHKRDVKGDTTIPTHGSNFEAPRNSGMFSEISSASSIDTSSVEDEAADNSKNLHRNLVDPGSVSTASVDTAKLNTSSSAADRSFTGPSSQEIPKNDEGSWSNTATGLAAGAGAAVAGAGAALLAKAGLTGDSTDASGSQTGARTGTHAGTSGSYTDSNTGVSTGSHSVHTGDSTRSTGLSTGTPGSYTDSNTGISTGSHGVHTGDSTRSTGLSTGSHGSHGTHTGHSTGNEYSSSTGVGHAGTKSDYSNSIDGRDTSTPATREPDASYGYAHSHERSGQAGTHSTGVSTQPTSSEGFSTHGYDPLGNENEGQVPIHGANFATGQVKPSDPLAGVSQGSSSQKFGGQSRDPGHGAKSAGASSSSYPVSAGVGGGSSQKYDPHGRKDDPSVPVHDTEYAAPPKEGLAAKFDKLDHAGLGDQVSKHSKTAEGQIGKTNVNIGGHNSKEIGAGVAGAGALGAAGLNKYGDHLKGSGNTGTHTPVSGDFEGVGSQQYDPHGSKADPAVPVHDSHFATEDAKSHAIPGAAAHHHSRVGESTAVEHRTGSGITGASASTGSREFEGTTSQKYDPHGRKADPAVPVHDSHFATEDAKHHTGAGLAAGAGATAAGATAVGATSAHHNSRAPADEFVDAQHHGAGLSHSGASAGTRGLENSSTSYDPHGRKDEPAVPVHDSHFATEDAKSHAIPGAAAHSRAGESTAAEHRTGSGITGAGASTGSREFEGTSSQKYDPHGRKADPAVSVHDSHFATEDAKHHTGAGLAAGAGATAAGATAVGATSAHHNSRAPTDEFVDAQHHGAGLPHSGASTGTHRLEGTSALQYDPHGRKDDPRVPVHDTEYAASPKEGLAAKFDKLDHAGLGDQVNKHSKTAEGQIGKTNVNIGGHNSKEIGAGVAGAGALGAAGLNKYGDRLKGKETDATGYPVSGGFDGSSTQKYDPHGRKGDPAVPVHDTEFSTEHGKKGDYKTLDPAAKDEKYVTELSHPSTSAGGIGNTTLSSTSTSKPIVTDGVQSASAPTKSVGTETGTHSNNVSGPHSHLNSHAGAGVVGGAAAGGLAAPHLERAPDSQASVRSLDSRTAPVPDSHATVSGIPQGRFAAVNETSDNRRHSKESYSTTGETDFEDAIDYGSPDSHAHHGGAGTGAAIGAGTGAVAATAAHGANDTSSISSQSTIGKRQAAPKAKATTEAVVPAGSAEVEPSGVTSAGSASTGATKDTRPSTSATDASLNANNKSAAPGSTTATAAHHNGNAPDFIPTNVLQQNKKQIGGDGSALEGPPIDKEKVEEMHEEVIHAAQVDGKTQGITSGAAAAAANVKGAPGKHAAGKEGEDVAAPDSKKGCRCC